MSPGERMGAHARVVERVLDEVAARESEPSERPRFLVWAALRWAAGDEAARVEMRELWSSAFGDDAEHSADTAFGWVRSAALGLYNNGGQPWAEGAIARCLATALTRLGEKPDAARTRIDGEIARALEALAPRAAA